MKRVIALYFPYLPTDRLRSSIGGSAPDPSAERRPVVLTAPRASVTRVVAANARALAAGVRVGMPLAEADAIIAAAGPLVAYPHDGDADRKALESLAIWAGRYSPFVHLEGDDTLLLDMTGSQRMFPDEVGLLRDMAGEIEAIGYAVRVSMADTPGAAWAMTHAHADALSIAAPGRTAAELAPLPAWSLRIDADAAAKLRVLGVETVEALLHLPRSSIAARFGDELLHRLDRALGDAPELLTPFRPRPAVRCFIRIAHPTDGYDVLNAALDRVTVSLCGRLERMVAGVRRVFVTFERIERRPVTFEHNLCQPTRSARHLRSLLATRLDRLSADRVDGKVTALSLWARETEPLDARQEELFDTGRSRAEHLTRLVDRLSARLGEETVAIPQPRSDHQPECAFEYSPAFHANQSAKRGSTDAIQRPARPTLLADPVAVPVIAIAPEGPPACFDWRGCREEIAHCVGPERIETGWWRGVHVRRDYFRAICRSVRRCWLFRDRDTGRWFLHGWFD